MIKPQSILVADDHPVVRHGVRTAIEEDPLLRVVAEVSDGDSALAAIQRLRPNIAILDIDMPKMDGFEVARELQRLKFKVLVAFLTMHGQQDLFEEAMSLGARGFILKESALVEIVGGLRAIASGQYFVSAALTGFLLQGWHNRPASDSSDLVLGVLTPSERRILQMIGQGKASKEIAAELFIHFRTVENHRTSIAQKLGLHGPNTLLKYALQHKQRCRHEYKHQRFAGNRTETTGNGSG